MKICVLIMSTLFNPGKRNVEAFRNTVIKDYFLNKEEFENEYVFYEYCAQRFENEDFVGYDFGTMQRIIFNEDEGVYRTFEKTMKMMDFVSMYNKDFDFIIRINISMFLNLRVVDRVVKDLEKDVVYCNAVNTIVDATSLEYLNDVYPRGDLMIFSYELMKGILSVGGKYMYCDVDVKKRIHVDHVDDCMIGVCLIDLFGKEYYKHIKMLKYNFLPQRSDEIEGADITYCIGSRVKTIPEGEIASGYSWEDNECRKFDCLKFEKLLEKSKTAVYDNVSLDSVLEEKRFHRPTAVVFIRTGVPVEDCVWEIIKEKRR